MILFVLHKLPRVLELGTTVVCEIVALGASCLT
jgi:hypothetical protein